MKIILKLINLYTLHGMILNKIFSIFNPPPITPPSKKTIRQLEELDDVWVKDGDSLYKGMVWEVSRRHITVIYGDNLDYKFRISKQTDVIEQDDKILYCNKPDGF